MKWVLVFFAFLATTGMAMAETREDFASRLEVKTKNASCNATVRPLESIPDYKECKSSAIGTETWFACAGGVDKVNRAIFFWNSFVDKCQKSQ